MLQNQGLLTQMGHMGSLPNNAKCSFLHNLHYLPSAQGTTVTIVINGDILSFLFNFPHLTDMVAVTAFTIMTFIFIL